MASQAAQIDTSSKSVSKYLPAFELNLWLTAVWASLGMGKTFQCVRLVKRAKTATYISPRRSLVSQACLRLGMINYENVVGPLNAAKIGVCLNSIQRRLVEIDDDGYFRYELLIIDEVEQCLQAIFSSLVKEKSPALLLHLRSLCLQHEKVLLLDAHGDDETTKLFAMLMGLDVSQYESKTFVGEPPFKYVHRYASFEGITFAVEQALTKNERPAVACTSKNDAKLLAARCQALGYKVLLITSESDDHIRATLEDPNTAWLPYDALIFSPTVQSGVSFDIPDHFTSMYLIARSIPPTDGSPSILYTDLLQMVRRIRDTFTGELHAWVEPKIYTGTTDFEEIVNTQLDQIRASLVLVSRLSGKDIHLNAIPINEIWLHTKSWCLKRARERGNNLNMMFFQNLQGLSISIIDVDPLNKPLKNLIAKRFKLSRKALEQDSVQEILAAKIISPEKADYLHKTGCADNKEKASMRRARILAFFGHIDGPIIKDAIKNNLQRKLTTFVALSLYIHSHFLILSKSDRKRLESDVYSSCEHDTLKTHTLVRILDFAGLDTRALVSGFLPQSNELPTSQQIGSWSKHTLLQSGFVEKVFALNQQLSLKDLFAGHGISLDKNFSKNPTSFVARCLNSIGLKTLSIRTTRNGQKFRTYSIDPHSLTTSYLLAQKHNQSRRATLPNTPGPPPHSQGWSAQNQHSNSSTISTPYSGPPPHRTTPVPINKISPQITQQSNSTPLSSSLPHKGVSPPHPHLGPRPLDPAHHLPTAALSNLKAQTQGGLSIPSALCPPPQAVSDGQRQMGGQRATTVSKGDTNSKMKPGLYHPISTVIKALKTLFEAQSYLSPSPTTVRPACPPVCRHPSLTLPSEASVGRG